MTRLSRGLRHGAVAVAGLWVLSMATAAPPQTVYRCGPDGRVYSQTPCVDGQPVTIDDSRTAAQQRAARETAAREAKRVEEQAAQRRQREQAAARHDAAVGIKPAAEAPAASAAKKSRASAKQSATESSMSPPMRVPLGASAAK
jgi:hypothetical protein